ncbi:hypothetical protein RKD55_000245 [Rossellomorea marisflavi]
MQSLTLLTEEQLTNVHRMAQKEGLEEEFIEMLEVELLRRRESEM